MRLNVSIFVTSVDTDTVKCEQFRAIEVQLYAHIPDKTIQKNQSLELKN